MYQTKTTKEKLKLAFNIFIPILFSQILINMTSFLDTLMAGHASANDLAGVAMATSLWIPVQNGLSGILIAVTPIISNKIGASEDKDTIRKFFIQALYVAFFMGVLSIILAFCVFTPVLEALHLSKRVYEIASQFILYLSTGFIPFFLYTVVKCFFESHGKTKLAMYVSLTILPINTLINYLLIFGHFNFPKMGGVGTGIATSISYWIAFIVSVFILNRVSLFKDYNLFRKIEKPNFTYIKELLKTGVPIGLAIFFEVSIFAVVTLLMSEFSVNTIAAHQAAMNFSSLLFMIPLSISMTLTIITGYEFGAKRLVDARQYTKIGLTFAVCFSVLTALILFLFRVKIAGFYSSDQALINLTANFLVFAIFFQISDAMQAPIQGVLRGYKDVKFALIMTLIGYWAVGLPIGYICANYTNLEAYGYWIGFITGLFICATGLSIRLKVVQKKLAKEANVA